MRGCGWEYFPRDRFYRWPPLERKTIAIHSTPVPSSLNPPPIVLHSSYLECVINIIIIIIKIIKFYLKNKKKEKEKKSSNCYSWSPTEMNMTLCAPVEILLLSKMRGSLGGLLRVIMIVCRTEHDNSIITQ